MGMATYMPNELVVAATGHDLSSVSGQGQQQPIVWLTTPFAAAYPPNLTPIFLTCWPLLAFSATFAVLLVISSRFDPSIFILIKP